MVKIPVSLQPKGIAVKAPTVTQQKRIEKYGSVEGYKQYQKKVAEVSRQNIEIEKINAERKAEADRINAPILIENKLIASYNRWVNKARKNIEKYGWIPSTIPSDLKGTQYEKKIKSIIEISQRGELRNIEQQLIQEMRQEGIAYLEKHPSAFVEEPTPVYGPVQPTAEERAIWSMGKDTTLDWNIMGQGTRIDKPVTIPTAPPTPIFTPSSMFFGDKEIRTSLQPWEGTIIDTGFSGVKPGQRIDVTIMPIRADYSTGVKARATEFIPVAGIPLTQMDEPIYLPNRADADKFKKLLKSKAVWAAKDMRIFLRNQEVKLKKDLGRYNELNIKNESEKGLTSEEIKESDTLRNRINIGQRGTLRSIVYKVTEEATARGEKVSILGKDVSPRIARRGLIFGTKGYAGLTDILMFQIGGAVLGGTVGATATGAKVISTVGKVTKPLIAPLGLTYMGLTGYGEFKHEEDIGDAIFAGAGAGFGFFGGVYSKQIVGGVGKGVGKFISFEPRERPMGKRGYLGSQKLESKYVYDYKKQRFVTRADLENILLKPEVAGKTVKIGKSMSFQAKAERLRALLKLAKGEVGQQEAFKMARELYGKEFVADFIAQEITQPFSIGGQQAQPFATPKVTQIMSSSIYAGTGLYELTGDVGLRMGSKMRDDLMIGERLDIFEKVKTKQEQALVSELGFGQAVSSLLDIKVEQKPKSKLDTLTTPKLDTITKQKPRQVVGFGMFDLQKKDTTTRQKLDIPKLVPPVITGIWFGGRRGKEEETIQGYSGEVKVKGKYQKVTTQPHTKSGARDVIARIIDHTISAQGRVVPIKKKTSKKLQRGDDYYDRNKNKFRGFKMYKGKRVAVKDTIIEKKQYRLDKIGETKGMTVAQFRAQGKLGRPKKKIPFRL